MTDAREKLLDILEANPNDYHAADAILTALPEIVRAMVKPLVWGERIQKMKPIYFITNSTCGKYQVKEWIDGSGRVICFDTPFGKPARIEAPRSAGGPEPLKAAAQDHHAAQIMTALGLEVKQ